MTVDGVAERLRLRGRPWPAPIHHLPSVGSTNDWLKERSRAGAPEWTAVLADVQTAGRGRQGRTWHSPEGNLYLSVLLRPPAHVDGGLLPLLAGVAVSEAVEEAGVATRLKWPNDVQAGGRKLAGILAEASGQGAVDTVVLGIGVNLVLAPRALGRDLASLATSVAAEGARPLGRDDAAAAVLLRLAHWYYAFSFTEGGAAALLAAWKARSVDWWGRLVEVRSGGSLVRGIARGLDDRGALLLELDGGRRESVLCGDARELRLAAE